MLHKKAKLLLNFWRFLSDVLACENSSSFLLGYLLKFGRPLRLDPRPNLDIDFNARTKSTHDLARSFSKDGTQPDKFIGNIKGLWT